MARRNGNPGVDLKKHELSADQLRWRCDASSFCFQTTKDVEPLQEFIGQDRAIRAIDFGLSLNRPGYNIFVSGLTGTGKMSVIKAHLEKLVSNKTDGELPEPKDWCYVYNFSLPDRPRILRLPRGKGKTFRTEMEQLLETIKKETTKSFTDEEYEAKRKEILGKAQDLRDKLFREVDNEAKSKGFDIRPSALGIAALPLDSEGKPMTREAYNALKEEDRQALDTRQNEVVRRIQEAVERSHLIEKESADQLEALAKMVAEYTIKPLFAGLTEKYGANAEVKQHLEGAQSFVMEHREWLRVPAAAPDDKAAPPSGAEGSLPPDKTLSLAFEVNVFVDNGDTRGLPIVVETNPTYANMFGKLERRAFMGAYFSDHTMLKPGALALANGGYLIVSAREVLLNPGVWEGLKRTIKNKELRLEDPWESVYGFIMPVGLRPEPVPIEVKVIMAGDSFLYHLLSMGDEDFWEMFKIRADFDFEIERNSENMNAYASLISSICKKDGLCHFDPTGVSKVIEYGARLVSDQRRLSSRFGMIRDILIEADQIAKNSGKSLTTDVEVKQAIEAKVYRSDLVALKTARVHAGRDHHGGYKGFGSRAGERSGCLRCW